MMNVLVSFINGSSKFVHNVTQIALDKETNILSFITKTGGLAAPVHSLQCYESNAVKEVEKEEVDN